MADIKSPITTPSPQVLSPRPGLNNQTSHQEVRKLLVKSFPWRTSHHLGHGQSHCWQLVNQGTADTCHRCCVEGAKASSWVGSKNSLLYRPLALFYSSSLTLPSRTICSCEVQHCKQDSRYAVRQCLTGLACAMHNGQELNKHAKCCRQQTNNANRLNGIGANGTLKQS